MAAAENVRILTAPSDPVENKPTIIPGFLLNKRLEKSP